VKGFIYSKDDKLNGLAYLRLLNTWRETAIPDDAGRARVSTFILSTIPKRVIAYLPVLAEPTILEPNFHPFDYSFRTESLVSTVGKNELASLGELSTEEKAALSPFLDIQLPPEQRETFFAMLKGYASARMTPGAKIAGIIKSFEKYQYELGFTDDTSMEHLLEFARDNKTGDCTEFSNTAAVLGRLLGIPSRVVTGYLASRDLQTQYHVQGIIMLRDKIDLLKAFPLEELYLVTTAHRHSWVEFYLSGYGWVDFEATADAIPPPAGMDPNEMPVVIPLIDPKPKQVAWTVPWDLVGRAVLVFLSGALAFLYLLRYGKETALALASRRRGIPGARARYELLLMRLAALGLPLKPRSNTPQEYAEAVPSTTEAAHLYTELRFRTSLSDQERNELARRLAAACEDSLKAVRKESRRSSRIKSAFSLRGLHYV
jgi:hypothetical protein